MKKFCLCLALFTLTASAVRANGYGASAGVMYGSCGATYAAPAVAAMPVYAAPLALAVPTYAVPVAAPPVAAAPVCAAPLAAPAPTYAAPAAALAPSYAAPVAAPFYGAGYGVGVGAGYGTGVHVGVSPRVRVGVGFRGFRGVVGPVAVAPAVGVRVRTGVLGGARVRVRVR